MGHRDKDTDTMILRDLARLRLHHQQILRPVLRHPAEVIASLCAVQAQGFAGTLWSIALRHRMIP